MSHEFDVIVVGAGAAGLGAGLALQQAGLRYQVLEAQARRGGRAWTDHVTFPGIAFDRGCHWLHDANNNPLTQAADALGYHYDRAYNFHKASYHLGGRRVDEGEADRIRATVETAYERVKEAGEAGRDIAPAEVLDLADPWTARVDHYIGLDAAATIDSVSAIDLVRGVQLGHDYPVEEGYGALLEKHTEAVEVALSTAVTAIDMTGPRVRVETTRGLLEAGAVIVTVSTAVLAAGGIRITPGLPPALEQAIADTPMGCAEKVAFLLDAPLEGFGSGHTAGVDDLEADPRVPLSYYVNVFGQPLVVAHFGGKATFDLAAAGEKAMIEAAREGLVQMAGSKVLKRICRETATTWWLDPTIRGAYSYTKVGRADARTILPETVEGRLFLAGEAVSQDAYATCHGAYISGQEAAAKAMAAVRASAA